MPPLIRRILLSLPLGLALLAFGIALVVAALAEQAEPHAQASIGPTSHQVAADAATPPRSGVHLEGPLNPRIGAAQP